MELLQLPDVMAVDSPRLMTLPSSYLFMNVLL